MSLLRRAGMAFLIIASGKLLSYASQIFIARLSGPVYYGMYSYAIAVVTTLSVFASLGFNNSAIKFLPVYQSQEKWSEIGGFMGAGKIITIINGGLLGLLCFLILFWGSEPFSWKTALCYGIMVVFVSYVQLNSQFARGLGLLSLSMIPDTIIKPIIVTIIFVTVYLLSGDNRPLVLSTSLLLGLMVSSASVIGLLHRVAGTRKIASTAYRFKEWFNVSGAMILTTGFLALLSQSDLFMVGTFISPSSAGFYNVATRVSTLASFFLAAMNQVFVPQISKIYNRGDVSELQRELARAALLTFIPTLMVAGLVFIISRPLLLMFGPNYIEASGSLYVLLIGQVVNASAGPVGYVLNMTGNHKTSTRIYGFTSIINVVGCYFAARFIGTASGVAWVTTSSMVLWNLWMHIAVVRRTKVWPSIFWWIFGLS